MEALLAALEASGIATYLRSARWGYAAVNGAHVLGIAVLVGAILPLDLRLLGFWRGIERGVLVRVLAPTAACGLVLAVVAGVLLFSVRAGEYAALTVFQVKLALIVLGTLSALGAHLRYGGSLQGAPAGALRGTAVVSLLCWLGALTCGRLIAFVTG